MNSYMRGPMIYLEKLVEKDDQKRIYTLGLPVGSPYEEVFEVLDGLKDHVKQLEADAKKRAEEEKAKVEKETKESQIKEEPVEVVPEKE